MEKEINNDIIDWLLEENNPGVRLRTLRELCGYPENHTDVKNTRKLVLNSLEAVRDLSWRTLKFDCQKVIYNLTALAESGLSRNDVDIDSVVNQFLEEPHFGVGCSSCMKLRAILMLGYENDPRFKQHLPKMKETQLPDGGWLCLHRVKRMKKIPKSCMRAAIHGLLFVSELLKKGIKYEGTDQLVNYFLKRRLFYRTDNPKQLVFSRRPGRRMTDIFFPSEYFYVGLPLLLESLATLGAGNAKELDLAWRLLDEKKDTSGRIILEGTMPSKITYLPKERVGKPSKWATMYTYIALQKRDNNYTDAHSGFSNRILRGSQS